MNLSWPAILAAALAVTLAIVGLAWRGARGPRSQPVLVSADRARLVELPRYRSLARRHRRWLTVAAVAGVGLVLSTGALAARPVRQETVAPVIDNRDVLLCLDVSGSMVEYNRSILERFGELVDGFDGERIGMTVFNSSAVPAFPLTTDHRFVTEEFRRFQETFAERGIEALAGTMEGDGTSLVPDGVASCALSLPEVADGRSRAMVIATDNIVEGASVMSMPEVMGLLVQRDIRAYVLFPMFSFELDRPGVAEMRELTQVSGGRFFGTQNPTAVASIIDEVEALEVARLDVPPAPVRVVDTRWWLVLAAGSALVFGLAMARVRR